MQRGPGAEVWSTPRERRLKYATLLEHGLGSELVLPLPLSDKLVKRLLGGDASSMVEDAKTVRKLSKEAGGSSRGIEKPETTIF